MTLPSAPPSGSRSVLLAFDKFKGTASARDLVDMAVGSATAAGWRPVRCPLADGGEGSLDALGGANKFTTVAGPLGEPVRAGWRQQGREAFIEMAAASGLDLAGGAEGNEPLRADTTGTGQLISAAIERGCRRISVFLGGSATTDGGWGALSAMPPAARLKEVDLVVACDVSTLFCDAARIFGPQKGASPAQVALLTRRLERLSELYRQQYGRDVAELPGAGAAGGLAGALAAVGGHIVSGFEAVAEWVHLDELLDEVDLVVTGEGRLDQESFNGKVVGGVLDMASAAEVQTLIVVGETDDELKASLDECVPPAVGRVVSLSERFGPQAARSRTTEFAARALEEELRGR